MNGVFRDSFGGRKGYIDISGLMPMQSVFSDFLQSRLDEEVTEPGFSRLPFRYAEVSKVLLDV